MIIGCKLSLGWRCKERYLPYPKFRKYAAGTYSFGPILFWCWKRER